MADDYGNKQKHESGNPIQRALIDRFVEQAVGLLRRSGGRTLLDVGCGEGYMLDAFSRSGLPLELHGVDLSDTAIADAKARLGDRADVAVQDARELARDGRRFDVVTMLEVLEHIPEPEQMLPILEGLSHRWLLLSVPWEPFFRGLNFVRGKHVRAWGNDPEHVNHWGRKSFLAFVDKRFSIVAAPMVFPWTMVLAERR